jgi:hypothetical protein
MKFEHMKFEFHGTSASAARPDEMPGTDERRSAEQSA